MKRRNASAAPAEVVILRPSSALFSTPHVGRLTGMSEEGLPLVDFEGNPSGPVPARVLAGASTTHLEEVAPQTEVLLTFEGGLPGRPILMGLLEPRKNLLRSVEAKVPALPVSASVDGQRIVLEGQDEILLLCGEASITLRRNGRVVIRGTQIESHASGVQRIKGAAVKVN
ncbi:hypothetical protein HUA76_44285 [Myxococcus sp. CA056]|uniref:DUF6484 domain-containing protein n=1 Tax=Myxococcus sp. CA056 TaxID=2741740 RepID=UPI00157B0CE4|nr:DUF6484 domain-containing protein [Myxococcus sp. CA056]NTX17803.1 hypothetical protein [Myxococcus sp. CA056]